MPHGWTHRIPCLVVALALAGCQTPLALHQMKQPLFTLGADSPGDGVTITGHPAQDQPVGQLMVSLQGALASMRRRVLASVADVDHVTVVVAVGGATYSKTVDKTALTAGQTSVTFDSLPVGSATVTITAYDLNGQAIGTTSKHATVTAGQVASVDIKLQLDPTILPSTGGGSTATTGGLTTNITVVDGAVMNAPLPANAATHQVGLFPAAVAVDASGNVWIGGMLQDLSGGVVKLSPTGQELARLSFETRVTSLTIDAAGHLWVADDVSQSQGLLWEFLPDGTEMGHWPIGPGAKQIAVTTTGEVHILNEYSIRHDMFTKAGGLMPLANTVTSASLFTVGANWGLADGSIYQNAPLAQDCIHLMPSDFHPAEALVDAAGNYWALGMATESGLKQFDRSGNVLASIPNISGALLEPSQPDFQRLAIDASGDLWVTNGTELVHVAGDGTLVGSYAYPRTCLGVAAGVSGLWVMDGSDSVTNLKP